MGQAKWVTTGGLAGLQDVGGISETFIDVRTYGAAGDGVTDDTAAIQAALDAATNIHAALVSLGLITA